MTYSQISTTIRANKGYAWTLGVVLIGALFTLGAFAQSAFADSATPSTNDANRGNDWAHVNQVSKDVGETDLEFVAPRSFYSCFEYRTDGDTGQVLAENGGVNYNSEISDGLYPYFCLNNETETHTIEADEYVEVRMVFGAEKDERFDWTRFEVDQADGDICHWDNGKKEYTLAPNTPGHQNHENDVPVDEAGGCPDGEPVEETVTIHAQKIVCDDESDLPNWGAGNIESEIDENTATQWLSDNEGNGCELVPWDFEWSFRTVGGDPEDNAGFLGGDWTAFEDGTAVIDVSNAQDLGLREVFKDGYVSFTGQNTDQDVSAEFYCGTDVLHYDNWEWIDAVAGEDYYCVAWNVPTESQEEDMCDLTVVSDETSVVVEGGDAPASLVKQSVLDAYAGAWTASIPGAERIWDNEDGSGVYIRTFKKEFEWDGTVTSAVLDISTDNSYRVWINGVLIPQAFTYVHPGFQAFCDLVGDTAGQQCEEFNYRAALYPNGQDQFDVADYIDQGTNTLKVEVSNWHGPAYALYKLAITGDEENCGGGDKTTDVTICKIDDEQNPLPGWTVMLLGDKVGDTVVVPSDGTEVFSDALTNGDPYAFIANGTYTYRPGYSGDISDAGFTKRTPGNDPIDPTTSPFNPWVDVNDLPSGVEGYLGIAVDGDVAGTNWSDIFNSLHTYALGYTGTGAGAGFKIWDDVYGDNSGSLSVDVYNGYVGETGRDGCVTFDDVPVGGYTLDEIMQDGWENVDGKGDEVPVTDESNTFYLVNSDGEEAPVCDPQVNLLKNGGFEAPDIGTGTWNIFYTGEPLLEWITNEFGIEIQDHVAGSPFNGGQHAELDPNHPTAIWQDVDTIPGETYRLETYYSPRPGRDLEDNRFEFTLNGSALGASIARTGVGNTDTDWSLETRYFVAGDDSTEVGFREIGTDTSYGAYLDDAGLYCIPKEDLPECSDGEDNDEDEYTDWPADPGCDNPQDDDEGDDPEQCIEGAAWAAEVVDADQGFLKNGGAVLAARSIEDSVLGEPDATTNPDSGFYSLGFGGSITVKFDQYVKDVEGDDLSFHEITNGRTSYPEELAKVEVSQDGSTWKEIGTVSSTVLSGIDYLDFSGTGWSWIRYVRVTDISDPNIHSATADGYDLDAIDAKWAVCDEPDPIGSTVTICKYEDSVEGPKLGGWTVWLDRVYEDVLSYIALDSGHYEGVTNNDSAPLGCVVLDNVPYGTYELGEDGQKGWHFVESSGDDNDYVEVNDPTENFYIVNGEDENGGGSDECLIEGHKFDENGNPLSGWTIGLFEFVQEIVAQDALQAVQEGTGPFPTSATGQVLDTDVTDDDGYYCLSADDVGQFGYGVFEELKDGWSSDHMTEGDVDHSDDAEEEVNRYTSEQFDIFTYVELGGEDPLHIDFYNEEDRLPDNPPTSTSGGGGTSFRRGGGFSTGEVLGASTDGLCPFLRDYQHISFNNDPFEVNKAKAFFNAYMGKHLALDGIFDQEMYKAVVEFQEMFKQDVLDTWAERFTFLDDQPTGYLYQTTKWKINSIMCPGYEAFPITLIPDSHGTSVASAQ